MIATPLTHVATFAKLDSFGPRSLRIDAAKPRGRAIAIGVLRDLLDHAATGSSSRTPA